MKLSKTFLTGILAFALVFGMTLAGCDNGTTSGGGGGGGAAEKPAKLESGASFTEAMATVDDIIAYCDANPTAVNKSIKASVQAQKSSVSASNWTYAKSSAISQINAYIDTLE